MLKDKTANRRKQVRVEADLLVRFADEQGGYVEECVGNVSKGGIFIESLKPRPLKEVLELFLIIPDSQEEITIQAEVVHLPNKEDVSDEHKGRMGMGLRFITIEPKQKEMLKNYIESLLEARGQGTREHSRIFDYKHVKVKLKSLSEFKSQHMPNISRGGLFFETDEELTLFDVLDLVLVPPKGANEIHLACEVVHIRKAVDPSEPIKKGIGVKFLQLTPDRQKAIDQFITQMLRSED